jgi:NADH:ubiquinone oxidoreductase subunit K
VPPAAAVTVLTEQVVKLRRSVLVVLVQSELVLSAPASQLPPEAVAAVTAERTQEVVPVLAVAVAAVELLQEVQPGD